MSGVILSLQCPKICCFSFLPLRRSHTTFCGSVPRQLIKATSDIQNSKDVLYKKKKKKWSLYIWTVFWLVFWDHHYKPVETLRTYCKKSAEMHVGF